MAQEMLALGGGGPWWAGGAVGAELAARWACWCVEGVGSVRMGRLHAMCGGAFEALWLDAAARRRALAGLGVGAQIAGALEAAWARPVWAAWEEALEDGAAPLFVGDAAYPAALRALDDAPIFVCTAGDAASLARPLRLGVVGSREAPQRWLEWTQEQAARLGGAGVCVVSGGAFGVDAAAHDGAMQGGGQTVAVMPCGLRERAPRGNRALFERVEAQGALVSEYPPRVAVRKHHFARRNRLIAALSAASVVVRAGEGSGALYTAQAALSLGRPVGAVPFDVLDEGAAGGVALLAGGLALAVRGAEDMLTLCGGDASALRAEAAREVARGVSCGLDGVAGAVFGLLGAQALGAEEVARGLGAGMGEVLGALLELELGGWAVKEAGRSAWRRA